MKKLSKLMYTLLGGLLVVAGSAFALDLMAPNVIGGIFNNVQQLGFGTAGQFAFSNTTPVIGAGWGTSPSIAANNGTASFTVNVGTGGTASTGAITMPVAVNGWACDAKDVTSYGETNKETRQIAQGDSTTNVTFRVFSSIASSVSGLWSASDVLKIRCTAY